MKVIVNNILLSVGDIWKIGEVQSVDEGTYLQFIIYFYNNTTQCVVVPTGCPSYFDEFIRCKTGSWEQFKQAQENSQRYKHVLDKFTKSWQQLVYLWSNNQTKIPKIEF